MNKDFPRLITLLRKERGESQKSAAANLGISQALLSHYEKGIRECGLDFLSRCADYYNVTTDYLLGRDSRRRPDTDLEGEPAAAQKDNVLRGSIFPSIGKAMSTSAVTMLFDLLQKNCYRDLAASTQHYLYLVIYKLFRYFYSANPENQSAFFAVPEELHPELTNAEMLLTEMRMRRQAGELRHLGKNGEIPPVSYDALAAASPQGSGALLNIVKNAEKNLRALDK